jgi:hypothetical protein
LLPPLRNKVCGRVDLKSNLFSKGSKGGGVQSVAGGAHTQPPSPCGDLIIGIISFPRHSLNR